LEFLPKTVLPGPPVMFWLYARRHQRRRATGQRAIYIFLILLVGDDTGGGVLTGHFWQAA
jgi:hypothetical protein